MTQPACPAMSSNKHSKTHSEAAASTKVSEDFLALKDSTTNSNRASRVVAAKTHSETFSKSSKSFSEVSKEEEALEDHSRHR